MEAVMKMKTIVCILCLTLMLNGIGSQALQCYVCKTESSYVCDFPDDFFLLTECNMGEVCKKEVTVTTNKTSVHRLCAKYCDDDSINTADGVVRYSYCCDADGCNGGIVSTSHSLVLLTMSLFGVASYWFIIRG